MNIKEEEVSTMTLKVHTIAQYKCLLWLMDCFSLESLSIEIVDTVTLRIIDQNSEQAMIHWHSQEGITLQEIEKRYVLGRMNNKYIVYRKEQENEVVESNGYVAITRIQEFTSENEAYEKLRALTESDGINELEDWSDVD